jgi:diphthamide biosynthesis protein 4
MSTTSENVLQFTTSNYNIFHYSSRHSNLAHLQDFYSLFSVLKDASQSQIKSAYHDLLLRSHPDKRLINAPHKDNSNSVDIALLKEAYTTLSNPDLRAAYDARLDAQITQTKKTVPRPAQVVSLEDFEEDPHPIDEDGQGPWRYPCRCGGSYTISTVLMEEGKHLVPCSSCSEVIWVGYEQVEDERYQE